MDDYDDYCDLIDDDEETVEMFKDIKEEYETWLDCYEDVHDDEFFILDIIYISSKRVISTHLWERLKTSLTNYN